MGFIAGVIAMLALDLGFFQREAHKPSLREAMVWSAVWVGLALIFDGGLYFWFGPKTALEFLTGYLIEKALSIDNLFVILVILTSLASGEAASQDFVLGNSRGAGDARFLRHCGCSSAKEFSLDNLRLWGLAVDHRDSSFFSAGKLASAAPKPASAIVRARGAASEGISGMQFHNHRERAALCHAVAACAGCGRSERSAFCSGFHSKYFRDHAGPLYRFHVQHLRLARAAFTLFPAGECYGQVPVPESGTGPDARLCRFENDAFRSSCCSDREFSGGRRAADRRFHAVFTTPGSQVEREERRFSPAGVRKS